MSPRSRAQVRRGFTVIEMLIAVAALAAAAAVVVSTLGATERAKLNAAASMVASDLEQARLLSISDTTDTTLVRIPASGDGYWLARSAALGTPIKRTGTQDYRVTFGLAPADSLAGVAIALSSGGSSDAGGKAVTFDAFGRLATSGDAVITLSNPSGAVSITVLNGTGDVLIGRAAP